MPEQYIFRTQTTIDPLGNVMTEKEVTIKNRAGIHARPAALIVQTANKFASKIHMIKDNEEINAKSIMGIITLGAGYNTNLRIRAEGPDEQEAVNALAELFERRFEEE
jgi:phosphocarrier protein HPr